MMKQLGNILMICFLLSFTLILISSAIFYGFNNSIVLTIQNICNVSPHDTNIGAFYFYGLAKIIMFFVFLIPSIAIKIVVREEKE